MRKIMMVEYVNCVVRIFPRLTHQTWLETSLNYLFLSSMLTIFINHNVWWCF